MNSQDLSTHQWKNRILLINIEESNGDSYETQINLLKKNEDGLEDRKLIVYQIKGGEYRKGISLSEEWMKIENEDFKEMQKSMEGFEVILIGLDGSVKRRQNSILLVDDLFSLIDSMPMRIQEIENEEK